MLTSKCPLCNGKEAFAVMVVNRQLIDLTRFLHLIQNRQAVEKVSADLPHIRYAYSLFRNYISERTVRRVTSIPTNYVSA